MYLRFKLVLVVGKVRVLTLDHLWPQGQILFNVVLKSPVQEASGYAHSWGNC